MFFLFSLFLHFKLIQGFFKKNESLTNPGSSKVKFLLTEEDYLGVLTAEYYLNIQFTGTKKLSYNKTAQIGKDSPAYIQPISGRGTMIYYLRGSNLYRTDTSFSNHDILYKATSLPSVYEAHLILEEGGTAYDKEGFVVGFPESVAIFESNYVRLEKNSRCSNSEVRRLCRYSFSGGKFCFVSCNNAFYVESYNGDSFSDYYEIVGIKEYSPITSGLFSKGYIADTQDKVYNYAFFTENNNLIFGFIELYYNKIYKPYGEVSTIRCKGQFSYNFITYWGRNTTSEPFNAYSICLWDEKSLLFTKYVVASSLLNFTSVSSFLVKDIGYEKISDAVITIIDDKMSIVTITPEKINILGTYEDVNKQKPSNYFFDNVDGIFKPCEESCSTCEDGRIGNICKVCSKNYYKKYDNKSSKECYNENTIPKNFFLDTTELVYKECDKSCASCSKNSISCLECSDGNYKKYNDDEAKPCYNEKTIEHNFYFDGKFFQECYSRCGSCYGHGDDKFNNCSSCAKGYQNNYTEPKNCAIECNNLYYLDDKGEYQCTKIMKCPDNYEYLFNIGKECVHKCNLPYFIFEAFCVDRCFSGPKIFFSKNKCNPYPEGTYIAIADDAYLQLFGKVYEEDIGFIYKYSSYTPDEKENFLKEAVTYIMENMESKDCTEVIEKYFLVSMALHYTENFDMETHYYYESINILKEMIKGNKIESYFHSSEQNISVLRFSLAVYNFLLGEFLYVEEEKEKPAILKNFLSIENAIIEKTKAFFVKETSLIQHDFIFLNGEVLSLTVERIRETMETVKVENADELTVEMLNCSIIKDNENLVNSKAQIDALSDMTYSYIESREYNFTNFEFIHKRLDDIKNADYSERNIYITSNCTKLEKIAGEEDTLEFNYMLCIPYKSLTKKNPLAREISIILYKDYPILNTTFTKMIEKEFFSIRIRNEDGKTILIKELAEPFKLLIKRRNKLLSYCLFYDENNNSFNVPQSYTSFNNEKYIMCNFKQPTQITISKLHPYERNMNKNWFIKHWFGLLVGVIVAILCLIGFFHLTSKITISTYKHEYTVEGSDQKQKKNIIVFLFNK